MAAITVTASGVVKVSGNIARGRAGVTLAQGKAVYADGSDKGQYKLADWDDVDTAVCVGIALQGASDEQPIDIQVDGDVNVGGAVLTIGETYFVGDSGGIVPDVDVVSGKFRSFLGVAVTTSVLRLGILNSGVAIP